MKIPRPFFLRFVLGFFGILSIAAIFIIVETRAAVRDELLVRAVEHHEEKIRSESHRLSMRTQEAALLALRLSHRFELRDFLSDLDSPADAEAARKRLEVFLSRNMEFSSAGLIGLDFSVLMEANRPGLPEGTSVDSSIYIEEGMDPLAAMTRIPVFVETSAVSPEGSGTDVSSVLRLTVPIFNDRDETLGILALYLPLSDLLEMLNSYASGGALLVIDENGRLLLDTRSDSDETESAKNRLSLSSERLRSLSRERSGFVVDEEESKSLLVFSRLDPHIASGVNATLVGVVPLDRIFQPLDLFLGALSFSVVAIFGLAMCVLAILLFRMIQPVNRLTDVMLSYNLGDRPLIESRDRTRRDEIGRLFSSFDEMAVALNESFRRNRNQVEELKSANQELEAKTREAEELARAKSDFLSVMSHEIRTPINAIVGFSQLLDSEDDPTEREHLTKRIIESSERLLLLIENILDFTRIHSGRVKIACQEFSPVADLESLIDGFKCRIDADKKSLKLVVSSHHEAIFMGDSHRVRQVISNLIENAIKFTPAGEIRVECGIIPDEPGYVRYEVRVIDSGIGIDEDKIDLIFLPFEQADHGMRREFEGTGLGLAISGKLAELMGGTLEVTSAPGEGSTFRLSLPLKIAEEDFDGAPSGASPRTFDFPPMRANFLIVEDVTNNAEMLRRILEKSEARSVQIAANGDQASELLHQNTFSVVLMDIQLSEENGIDLIERIRSGSFAPQNPASTPIVVITANALGETREQCARVGVDKFMTKPFSAAELSRAITPLIEGKDSEK